MYCLITNFDTRLNTFCEGYLELKCIESKPLTLEVKWIGKGEILKSEIVLT